jgi:hypothetical protein
MVGSKGSQISRGKKQTITIARAIIKSTYKIKFNLNSLKNKILDNYLILLILKIQNNFFYLFFVIEP